MTHPRRLCVCLLGWLATTCLTSGPLHAQSAQPDRRWGIRGVTVGPIESSQQPGRGYGTPYSAELLDELVRLGATWVSVTPFGRLWSLNSTQILMDFEWPYDKNRRGIEAFVAQAHARGLRVLVVPHLWIETEGWRGEIDPGTPEGWAAYRKSYKRFVLRWATDAARFGADAFSIGVECASFSGRFAPFWHELIAEVRSRFDGLLTYSSNWDEVENVIFWDRLDLIGVNAFYPLASDEDHSDAAYRRGAERALDGLAEVARTLEMDVVFVEVGYTTRPGAGVEPWLWPDNMQQVTVDEQEQARALSAILQAAVLRPWFRGFFVWRYYANLDDVSQEAPWGFSPHGKLAERVLERVFRQRWATDPLPVYLRY